MAALLGRSLQDVTSQRDGPVRRGASGGRGARAAPYSKKPADSWEHDKYDNDSGPAAGGRRQRARRDSGDEYDDDRSSDRKSPKLRIENLHYEVSESELEALFLTIGPLASGPSIKFDRSGRSEGIAWVTFTSVAMASAAKNQFQDAMAKGQPLKISYDHSKPRGLGEGAGLLARLGGDVLDRRNDRDRPARGGRGGSFGTSSGRGGPARGRGGRGGGGGGAPRSTPKTEADLDAELESFMRSDAPAKANGGDVQMAS